ncbi:MAG: hypothetical protein HYU68_10815 [Bacteroidetes bacterium]|nr:hypothetical protein [Bacteroidota bacterium]
MKKITVSILTVALLLINPVNLKAENTSPTIENSAESTTLLNRLDEINVMDKSELKFSEKRALRKEVKSIEKQLRSGGGVYISVGAIIIILLLLIILL